MVKASAAKKGQKEQKFAFEVEREKSGTVKIKLTVSWSEVRVVLERWMEKAIKEVEVPGFRKGKAPKEKAGEKLDREKVYEEVIRELLPQAYAAAVKRHNIRPVIYPKIRIEKAKEGEDWVFNVETCEAPEVTLGKDYKKRLRAELGSEQIWTPGKGKDEKEEDLRRKKEEKILEALLKVAKVIVPDILVREEANRRLSGLITKTEKLGVTMEQYLSSIGKSEEDLRGEYAGEARRALEVETVLNCVFEEEGLKVDDEEVERVIKASGDERMRQNLEKPEQKEMLKRMLARRVAFDYLVKLK